MLLRMVTQQKLALMAFKGKALRNSCISVNIVFYETLQVLIFAYSRVLWVFLANVFKKNHNVSVKNSERSNLA